MIQRSTDSLSSRALLEQFEKRSHLEWSGIAESDKVLAVFDDCYETVKESDQLKDKMLRWLRDPSQSGLNLEKVNPLVRKIYKKSIELLFHRELSADYIELLSHEEKVELLFMACNMGDLDEFKRIYRLSGFKPKDLEEIVHPKEPDVNHRLLAEAAASPNLDLFEHILELNPRVMRLKNKYGNTPIHEASSYGYLKYVQIFLEKDLYLARVQNNRGFYPVHLASHNGYLQIVEAFLVKYPGLLRKADITGCMPIHVAADHGHTDIVRWFLKRDGDLLNESDFSSWLPIHYAEDSQMQTTVELLLQAYLEYAKVKVDTVTFINQTYLNDHIIFANAKNGIYICYSRLCNEYYELALQSNVDYQDLVRLLAFIKFHAQLLSDCSSSEPFYNLFNRIDPFILVSGALQKIEYFIQETVTPEQLSFFSKMLLPIQRLLNQVRQPEFSTHSKILHIQREIERIQASHRLVDQKSCDVFRLITEFGITNHDHLRYKFLCINKLGTHPEKLYEMGLVEGHDLDLIGVFNKQGECVMPEFLSKVTSLEAMVANHHSNIQRLRKALSENDYEAVRTEYRTLRFELLKLFLKQDSKVATLFQEHSVTTLSELNCKLGGIDFPNFFRLETLLSSSEKRSCPQDSLNPSKKRKT